MKDAASCSEGRSDRIVLDSQYLTLILPGALVCLSLSTHQFGCLVVNAPTANTVAAAEHGIALLFSLARNIPAADAAMKAGESAALGLTPGLIWGFQLHFLNDTLSSWSSKTAVIP